MDLLAARVAVAGAIVKLEVAAEGEVGCEGSGKDEEDGENHALGKNNAGEVLFEDWRDEIADDAGVRDVDDFT